MLTHNSADSHVYVPVGTRNWLGRAVIVTRCACGSILSQEEIRAMRAKAGLR